MWRNIIRYFLQKILVATTKHYYVGRRRIDIWVILQTIGHKVWWMHGKYLQGFEVPEVTQIQSLDQGDVIMRKVPVKVEKNRIKFTVMSGLFWWW